MAPFPFLQRGTLAEHARLLHLAAYTPAMVLEGLATGVDNVRHDVFLSPRFSQAARQHVARLMAKYGAVEDLITADPVSTSRPPSLVNKPQARAAETADFKHIMADLHVVAINRAKTEGNVALDLLARIAIIKSLRTELTLQFASLLERCRAKQKSYEGPRQSNAAKALEVRERVARFQVGKKPILRRVGQDLFQTLREIEKETLARMRRSLLGEAAHDGYALFVNRLLFTEDGRDDYLNAEHYVMLGNYATDPDRLGVILETARRFLRSLRLPDDDIDALLCVPENAHQLVAGGTPGECGAEDKARKAILAAWVDALEAEGVMEYAIAAYEAAPLLAEYSPPINPQQLKNALISRAERHRVEKLLEDHGKLSPDNLQAAVKRAAGCRGAERAKIAGRFLGDFIRYYRDLRRLEALNAAMERVNVVGPGKLRELSAINNTLYEFLLAEEQKSAEDKVLGHVILKADIRDSTTLTRTLFERGLNAASYFSLNFYEPVNKLLPKYGATKVFIEGDAVILALFEHEGEPALAVARTCVLAKEIIDIVRAYNEKSQVAGLPTLELGIGISYQDSAPMYLMDGNSRIMISAALNESDRLSSCSRGARRLLAGLQSFFNVHAYHAVTPPMADADDESLTRYNIGGVCLNAAGFLKLQQEISLKLREVELPGIWKNEVVRLYQGVVPVGPGMFHKLVLRESRVAQVDPHDFALQQWGDDLYYEVCTTAAVYEWMENTAAAARSN